MGLTACSCAFGLGAAWAQNKTPVDGTEFWILEKPLVPDAPRGKIEVLEFFRYSCPHCFEFEPAFEAWVKRLPKHVEFKRNPVSYGDDGGVLQRLYYALETMDLVDKLHSRVFNAIHVEKLQLNTDAAVINWVERQGIDRKAFAEQLKSFSVASKVSRAKQREHAFLVEGVPSLGIAGKYYTGGSLTRTRERALDVADFLIAEITAGR